MPSKVGRHESKSPKARPGLIALHRAWWRPHRGRAAGTAAFAASTDPGSAWRARAAKTRSLR
eukprot:2796401-Prymnesium_polylepis.1